MPREAKTKSWNNAYDEKVTYRVTPFGAKKGFRLLPKVMKLIGGPLGNIVDAFGSDGATPSKITEKDLEEAQSDLMSQKIDGAALAAAIESLADHIEDNGVDFCLQLLSASYRKVDDEDFKQIDDGEFEVAYQANYIELVRALAFVLEVNYLPMFKKKFGSMLDKVKTNIASLQKSGHSTNEAA